MSAAGWTISDSVVRPPKSAGWVISDSETSPKKSPPIISTTLTENPKGEGLYEMWDANGNSIKVPYSKVMDAAQQGYGVTQKEREHYARDKQWEIEKHNVSIMKTPEFRNLQWGNQSPQAIAEIQRVNTKMRHIENEGLPEAINPPAERQTDIEREKFYAATEPVQHQAAKNVLKRVARNIFGVSDMPIQAWNALRDSLSDDPDIRSKGEDTLAHLMPPMMVHDRLKELQNDWKKDKALAVENLEGDAVGMFLIAKATEGAPKLIQKTKAKMLDAVDNVSQKLGGVHAKTAARIVAKTMEENVAAVEKSHRDYENAMDEYREKVKTTEHETKGREIQRQYEVSQAKNKAQEAFNQEKADVEQYNRQIHARAEERHAQRVQEVKEANARVQQKYEANSARIKEENAAAEHVLELRRQREVDLEKLTKEYYDKEDEVKAKAKAEENAAWQPWHEKMRDVTIDGGRIAKPLEDVAARSPDISRMLRNLVPDPADAAPDSQYALDRAAIMKSQGIDPDKTSYWDLPEEKRVTIDKIASSSGFEPDPIDFDPQADRPISVETIHRAKSILGRHIMSGRYEGMVLGEMKQVFKVLEKAETRASLDHGALGDLEAARKATRRYQEAFGRERHMPRTQDEIREKEANPEAFKERNDQERLEAAGKHSPELVSMYERVKGLRDEIRSMKTEDQLRRSIKRVPPAPSFGDLRDGYRLKAEPNYRGPSEGDLREGYRLKPTPMAPDFSAEAEQSVKQPERVSPPEEPQREQFEPEIKKPGTKELTEANQKEYDMRIDYLRRRGIWIIAAELTATAVGVLHSLTKMDMGGAIKDVLAGAVVAPITVVALNKLADFMERPGVRDFFTKPSEAQIKELEKLPADQRGKIAEGLRKVRTVAKKQGWQMSPLLVAYIGQNGVKKQ